jgi:hypothetical protein
MAKTQQQAKEQTLWTLQLLIRLGWTINWAKSELEPSQTIVFLGLKINSRLMQFQVPKIKIRDIQAIGIQILTKSELQQEIALKQVAMFIGKLMAIELAVFPTRLKTWNLIRNLNSFRIKGWHSTMPLYQKAQEEVKWWIFHLQDWNGRAILLPSPEITIQTDASSLGWGATTQNQMAGGPWSIAEGQFGNNMKELLAGFYGLLSFKNLISNHQILLQMDNTTAVSYVNKMGGRVSLLSQLAETLWDWCLQQNIQLQAQYLPGELNKVADYLSRKGAEHQDWMLNPMIFQQLNHLWGPHQVDLFASRLNHQIPIFYSWHPEPGTTAVDAFLQPWQNIRGWANPPFSLIGRVLEKVRKDKCTITLIAPIWSTQPWFPILIAMLIDYPRLLPQNQDLFLPGKLGNEQALRSPNWNSAAWHISGKQSYSKAFQQTLLTSYPPNLGIPLSKIINIVGDYLQNGGINNLSQHLIFLPLK